MNIRFSFDGQWGAHEVVLKDVTQNGVLLDEEDVRLVFTQEQAKQLHKFLNEIAVMERWQNENG